MKQLALRKLARPLSQARTNPEVGRAALFIEHLLGRPMRSDPDLIIVGQANKREFIDAVEQDFGAVFSFTPFPSLLTGEMRRRLGYHPESEFFGPADMALRPLSTYRRWQPIIDKALKRANLLKVAGQERSGALGRLMRQEPNGLAMKDEGIMVLNESRLPHLIVHELVHHEDYLILPDEIDKFGWKITEGRATYAQFLYSTNEIGEPALHHDPRFKSFLWLFRRMLEDKALVRSVAGSLGFMGFARDIGRTISNAARNSSYAHQTIYLPYACALADLAFAVGDPVLAFRISTGKLPTDMREMTHPLEFYRREIEKAL